MECPIPAQPDWILTTKSQKWHHILKMFYYQSRQSKAGPETWCPLSFVIVLHICNKRIPAPPSPLQWTCPPRGKRKCARCVLKHDVIVSCQGSHVEQLLHPIPWLICTKTRHHRNIYNNVNSMEICCLICRSQILYIRHHKMSHTIHTFCWIHLSLESEYLSRCRWSGFLSFPLLRLFFLRLVDLLDILLYLICLQKLRGKEIILKASRAFW